MVVAKTRQDAYSDEPVRISQSPILTSLFHLSHLSIRTLILCIDSVSLCHGIAIAVANASRVECAKVKVKG